jgi:sulfofructose kinase
MTNGKYKQHRVICVGHAALDRIYTVDGWSAGSAKVPAQQYSEAGGGMAANAAAAIAKLGGEAAFWGPTGDDAVSDAIRTHMIADGIDVQWFLKFPSRTSSHSAVILDRHGERLVVGYRGNALEVPANWLPIDEIGFARAVLADVRWPNGAVEALRAARNAGVPAILDAEIAERHDIDVLTGVADHIIFSERGMEAWAGHNVEGGLRKALGRGAAQMVAVTRGAAGVIWVESDDPHTVKQCPAFPVEAVDTLAAGDVFHGAYALAIAERMKIADAMRFASAAAAIKCSRPGGRAGAPTRSEVDAFLSR